METEDKSGPGSVSPCSMPPLPLLKKLLSNIEDGGTPFSEAALVDERSSRRCVRTPRRKR